MQSLTQQMADTTHNMVEKTKNMAVDIGEVRDNIADFDDFFRPIRNYFYWEPHCYDIPVCHSLRAIFDTLDGIDVLTDDVQQLVPELEHLDTLMPQLVAIMPSMIETMKNMKNITLTMYQSQKGQQDQMKALQENSTAMGQAFDASKNDDSFYLPPEVFDNPDFQRGMKMFVSPDGKAVRFIISHEGDPATPEGISHIDQIKNAAFEAIKGTPLEGSKIYLAGTASTYKDMQHGSNFDLLIAGIASLCLIFIIMLLLTRAVVAAAVIVGTVLLSLGTSFGLSVLIWQYILGMHLHWMIIAMSVIILLAVGSDYNLLLVSRFKEEIHAGINTGIIRSMGGTRFGGHLGRAGVRLHHDVDGGQRPARGRPGGHHHRSRPAVRHAGHPVVHDAVDRRAARHWFWWPQRVRQRPVPEPWPAAQDRSEPEPVGAMPGRHASDESPTGPIRPN